MTKIYLAADHAGVELKSSLIDFLSASGHEVQNLGTDSSESVDYPDFGKQLANQVSKDPDAIGIAICGSGIGINIAANRNPKIRAALCHNTEYAKLSRQHNDANILCLGARFLTKDTASEICDVFINTPFEGGRHEDRVNKLAAC